MSSGLCRGSTDMSARKRVLRGGAGISSGLCRGSTDISARKRVLRGGAGRSSDCYGEALTYQPESGY
jgi:hypothetical protein